MTELATFARIQHYGDGTPDPRTATCQRHVVASPYSDTAKGDGIDVDTATGWPCVVCPMPDADLIGTEVIVTSWDSTFVYAGPDADRTSPGWMSTSYSMRGGPSTVKCDVDLVAPAGTVIDLKDPRITVEKLPKKRDYQDAGPWLPVIDHPELSQLSPTAKATKREAVAYAARRLAIADFHATRVNA